MYAYKLMRERKDGSLGSLFINRRARYYPGDVMVAKPHPTPGFAFRPLIHCTDRMEADHLSKAGRRWVLVYIYGDVEWFQHRGQSWPLAQKLKIMSKM